MLGRRRHERYTVAQPWEGALRVLRDVAVQDGPDGALTVVSQAPAVIGELLSLYLSGGGSNARLMVRVDESRPLMMQGSLRHALRLTVLDREAAAEGAVA
jgi:hypothetical protein